MRPELLFRTNQGPCQIDVHQAPLYIPPIFPLISAHVILYRIERLTGGLKMDAGRSASPAALKLVLARSVSLTDLTLQAPDDSPAVPVYCCPKRAASSDA
jgi:hypothetical protein